MILPGDVPLTDDKVRTNTLLPIANGYDAVIAREVAGDLSKPAQIEARSPSVGKNKAVTRAATALEPIDDVVATERRPGSSSKKCKQALFVVVPHNEAGIMVFLDRPGRREAVGHSSMN
jgi:hypothetical protein